MLMLIVLCGIGWLCHPIAAVTDTADSGAPLFRQHCGSCHQLPAPTDLPLGAWDTVVLPRMQNFMTAGGGGLPAGDWERLRQYILTRAPEHLITKDIRATDSPLFEARFPAMYSSPPSGTFLSILPGRGIILGDINKEGLFVFDTSLRNTQFTYTGKGVTSMATFGPSSYATVIGSFSPTDEPTGRLVRLAADSAVMLIDGLRRPTDLLALPTPGKSAPSFIVSEYGKWAGRLSWYVPDDDDRYGRTVLSHRPGPMAIVRESEQAFLVLYGQGDERIVRFTRSPDGWEERTLLRFPPSYGSSSLRLIDWNGDAWPDLVYTGGDHADYRAAPKPYHGIRIFTGSADGSYRQAEFIPLPGAYDAVVADFDEDGQRDIAAIAFFPDFRQRTPASAVIFHRRGREWVPALLPASGSGRWIRLAAGDVDGDGDLDLAASSLAMEPDVDGDQLRKWVAKGLPFVLWKNKLKGNTELAAERR